MAPKRFNVLNALRFLIKRFNERVTFVIKNALRRFKCLGSLNSAENVGKRVGKLPWWGMVLRLVLPRPPPIVSQALAQLLIHTVELFVTLMRGVKVCLHALLLHLRIRHVLLQPPHYFQDLLHG